MNPLLIAAFLVFGADGDKARLDCFGDPLPDGALARMGTLRLRSNGRVRDAVLSADHATLVTLSDSVIDVWRTADGAHVRNISGFKLENIALSPDGKTLACAAEDLSLILVDVATGKEVRRLAEGQEGGFRALAFSPDGKTLAAGGEGVVRLWDTAAGKELGRWTGYGGPVIILSFSCDGSRLAAGAYQPNNPSSRVTETATGKTLCTFPDGFGCLSPDGKTVAVFPRDDVVSLWEVDGPKKIRSCAAESAVAFPVGFSPDGKTFWTKGLHSRSTLWDTASGEKRAEVFGGACCLSADGKVLAVSAPEGAVRLCDGTTGKGLYEEFGHSAAVLQAAWAPDGRTLLTGSLDDSLCLWAAGSGKFLRRLPCHDHKRCPLSSMTFSPDGRTVAALAGRLRRWDAATGNEQDAPAGPLKDVAEESVFSPDARLLFLGGFRDDPVLWDVAAGKEVRRLPGVKGVEAWFSPIFSLDGALAASAIVQDAPLANPFRVEAILTVAVWDADTGRLVRSITAPCEGRHDDPLVCLDARALVVATGRIIRFWDLSTGEEFRPPTRLAEPLQVIVLSPDGRFLAGAGGDGVVRLWETATRQEVRQWKGHCGGVSALAFSPDGTSLASGGDDTTTLVWDVAGRLVRPDAIATDRERDSLWAGLAGDDAARAFRAVQILAAAPERSVPLVKERLRPATPIDQVRLARRIADLDADDFDLREEAERELANLGRTAVSALRKALAANPPPEPRRRIEELLGRRHALTADELRATRAVCALEWAGTAEARELLEELAKGAAGAVPTEEARVAMQRLAKQQTASP